MMTKLVNVNVELKLLQNPGIYLALPFIPVEQPWSFFLILVLTSVYIYYILKCSQSIIMISICLILVLTIVSFINPLFSFIFMIFINSLFVVLLFPYRLYKNFFKKRRTVILKLLTVLEHYNILDFFMTIYVLFFYVPKRQFNIRLFLIVLFSLVYIITSRWYFYHSVVLHQDFSTLTQSLIFLLLFFGVSIAYLRVLVNISLILTPLAVALTPNLVAPCILYIVGEGPDPGSDQSLTSKTTTTALKPHYSFININSTRNFYHQYFNTKNPGVYRNAGLCIGFCAMTAAGFAAYFTKIQADAAVKSADAAVKAADAAVQAADATAYQAGLISKDEYYTRHPQDKLGKT